MLFVSKIITSLFLKFIKKLKMLEKEFKYYLDNQEELLKEYKGHYIVIKGEEVLGAFTNELDALSVTRKDHELGTFLIQKVSPGNEDYTETYHTRVVVNG